MKEFAYFGNLFLAMLSICMLVWVYHFHWTFDLALLVTSGFGINRLIICIRKQGLVMPPAFGGVLFWSGSAMLLVPLVVLVGTLVLCSLSGSGACSGVPLGLSLIPACLWSIAIVLFSELLSLKRLSRNAT